MPPKLLKPEQLLLKTHPEFSERWVQQCITEDPSLLGLGDVELILAEKLQPKAGRLDLLLHDEQLNRRYEVELMLGQTDPSHIIRCIEYWDIERRRYPAYDHVAVLVAEKITSRFLNVMSLLAGSIPLIAIQMSALKFGDQVALHFVQIIDQTALRTDDEYEGGARSSGPTLKDRRFWEQKVSNETLKQCDVILGIVVELSEDPHHLRYRKVVIDILPVAADSGRIWLRPSKTLIRLGGYVSEAEDWLKRFEELGLTASLRRGNKAVLVSIPTSEMHTRETLIREFVSDALKLESDD